MRKSLGTLALILIVIGVIGANREWFTLERTREGTTTEVQLRIDRAKIRNDTRQAAEKARELGGSLEEHSKAPAAITGGPARPVGTSLRPPFPATGGLVYPRARERTNTPPETTCTRGKPDCRRIREAT